MPYTDLPSYDAKITHELEPVYAFGKTYTDSEPEPFEDDDVVERKDSLAKENARHSPQTRLVKNMIVHTDETVTLARNYEGIGAALWTGRRNASKSTLFRHGKQAVSDAAEEIAAVRQELAA